MSFFTTPTSWQNNVFNPAASPPPPPMYQMEYATTGNHSSSPFDFSLSSHKPPAPPVHPPLSNLILLVFEAVLEVVCVSLPGYIIARCGMFDSEMQKFVANLNVSLFTPCLIFTKLASQLTLAKIAELAVIPFIFAAMTLVSYCCALLVTKVFKFDKRASNFVIAMGVFGNSNSLPMSLVISLSMTLTGLHWDQLPKDNDEEVAARGILYLLIFQQLGQLVRWSWGYHVLLAPHDKYDDQENVENGNVHVRRERYRDADDTDEGEDDDESIDVEAQGVRVDPFMSPRFENSYVGLHKQLEEPLTEHSSLLGPKHAIHHHTRMGTNGTNDSAFESGPSGDQTPNSQGKGSSILSSSSSTRPSTAQGSAAAAQDTRDITYFPRINSISDSSKPKWAASTPPFISRALIMIKNGTIRFFKGLWAFMNPPLWAMLIAIFVASIPKLQHLFFTPGTFLQNSVTRAVSQSGNVAVPLILVVLGANLAGNTQPKTNAVSERHETKILFASLISRMVLPFIFIAPMLAVSAKYLNISILDDPIFLVVCFLLTGAPSALQLAQICQINGVYEAVMARILFWSYVVVILPSTLILVISALEVVEWAL